MYSKFIKLVVIRSILVCCGFAGRVLNGPFPQLCRTRDRSTSHNPNRTGDEEQKTQANRQYPLCKSNHWVSRCKNFKEKSLAARWQFVTSRGLRANCLIAGHLANSCPKKGFCRVTGCNGKHSSYLHPKGQVPGSVSGNHNSPTSEAHSQSPNQENGQPTFNGYVKGRMDDRLSSASLAIIPVKVKAPSNDLIIETYAFLDIGSNVSFCSEELATQLGLSGRPTSLSITNMEKTIEVPHESLVCK